MIIKKMFVLVILVSSLGVFTSCINSKASTNSDSVDMNDPILESIELSNSIVNDDFSDVEEALDQGRQEIDSSIRGNRSENIMNRGLVAKYDGWIYYSGFRSFSFYKMQADGSNQTFITKEHVLDINIVDDWVYYSAFDGGIWKMHIDGTGKTQLYDKRPWHVHVIDDFIYFQEYLSADLYRMKTDGSDLKLLNNDLAMQTFYEGDYIYYLDATDRSKLYRMDLYGNNKTLVMDFDENILEMYIVQGDYLYNTNNGISRVNLLTGETKLLTEDISRAFNIYNGWIFYENTSDPRDVDGNSLIGKITPMIDSSFSKMRTDGSDNSRLSNLWPWYIQLVDEEWIYFEDNPKSEEDRIERLVRMRIDGSDIEDLTYNEE